MNRKEEQADLIYLLGQLLRPLQDIIDAPERHNSQSRARACAKFVHDAEAFIREVVIFSLNEPGHNYAIEANQVAVTRMRLQNRLDEVRDDDAMLAKLVAKSRNEMMKAILNVPTEIASEVLQAHSPFQAYCKLKAFCESTNQQLTWTDPYMGPGLFHRYLNDLPESAEVTLVTKDRGTLGEYQAFLDISRLYALERGPSKYCLVVESNNHDRWLQSDDQLYHLGGSAKDAGKKSDFHDNTPRSDSGEYRKTQHADLFREGVVRSEHSHAPLIRHRRQNPAKARSQSTNG